MPYEEQAVRWAVELRETYYDILAGCDKLTQLQTSYTRDCFKKHTQYAIGKSGHVLAVWDGTWRAKPDRCSFWQRNKTGRLSQLMPIHYRLPEQN